MILFLNIIIAQMNEVQAERTAEGRTIIVKTKLKFVIDNWPQVMALISENVTPKFIIGAIS
jgi:uncharacterized lipoprotein